MSKSIRQERQARRQRARIRNWIIGGVAGVAIIAVIILLLRQDNSTSPVLGEVMPIEGADHAPVGELPAQISSDPPTSGTHYDQPAEAGFYEDPVEDGYLIHSLEHGYVIISYNCEGLDESACVDLKDNINKIIKQFNTFKVIGVPRPGMDVPVAVTSWGRIAKLDQFNADSISNFVRDNRGKAPEPNAP